MLPHSYTLDSVSKSQDLLSTIQSATSPSQITSLCTSIETFLHSHSPDQSRHFFSLAFPTLICNIFGFENPRAASPSPSSNGWINIPELDKTLFSLLSPSGTLATSISAVDRLSLVKYLFPAERLPHWSRSLSDKHNLSDLCPSIFTSSSSSSQIQLNVFQYFFFWFAYYPVSKGNSNNSDQVSVKTTTGKFTLENWKSSIPGFSTSKQNTSNKKPCYDLYTRLLYAYLRANVPTSDLTSHQPYRSSILHYGSSHDATVADRAEFVVNTLIHFWLVDNDFSPFPVSVCKALGVSFPFGEMPPTPGLRKVVKLFVRYLGLSTVTAFRENGDFGSSYSPSVRWRTVEVSKNKDLGYACWNQCLQRPLYRFLLRTLLFSPMAVSVKNVSEVFPIWIRYLEPWNIKGDKFKKLDEMNGDKLENSVSENGSGGGFTSRWQDYVLSNYLYYTSLVMHFIGFAHRFLHSDVEIVVQMVLKVLDTLTSSKELIDLLKNMDTLFHSKQAGLSKPILSNLYRYVPIIREQLQDWEDGLCETDVDGSFLHDNWNKDLRLFADGEDGGQQLLQLFILRAEAELQAISGGNVTCSLKCIDTLKEKLGCLFDGRAIKPSSISSDRIQHQQSRDEIFKPRRAGNHMYTDVKYKGDWMRRPISSDEIAWFAKVLVWLSDWLNENLGLNQSEISLRLNETNNSKSSSTCSYVEVSTDVTPISGPSEVLKAFLCTICSWFLFAGAACLGFMRKYGLRVNLRILASKKVVIMVFVLYAVFNLLRKLF